MNQVSNEFTKLPLVEVRLNLAATGIDVAFGIASEIAHRVKDILPTVLPVKASFTPPASGSVFGEAMMFANNQGGMQIVLQAAGCVVSWKQPTPEMLGKYPRYPVLREHLKRIVSAYQRAKGESITFTAGNMAYTNFIAAPAPSPDVLQKYISGTWLPVSLGPQTPINEFNVGWQDGNNSDLRLSIKHVAVGVDKEVIAKGYHLTTVAGRHIKPGDELFAILDQNHNTLNELFPSFLTDLAKTEWGYQT